MMAKRIKLSSSNMHELSFRIILVPREIGNTHQKDKLMVDVKSTIEACGLTAVSVHYSQVNKSEKEDYPEIEEFILEVRGETSKCGPSFQLYEEFCRNWKKHVSLLPCSYIELYASKSFVDFKRAHHTVNLKSVSFGVLPHNGMFYQYARLNENWNNMAVDFYHDTRNVVLRFNTYQMMFSYENIRNIFVNIENEPSKVYFDLFNPPTIFRIESGRYQEKRHRNLDLRPVLELDDVYDILMGIEEEFNLQPDIDVDVLGRANVLALSFTITENIREVIAGIHHHYSEKSVYYTCISEVSRFKPVDPVIELGHFGCTYLMTAILRRNFVAASQTPNISSSLMKISSLRRTNQESLEKALTSVLCALDSGKIINFWHAIEKQYIHYTSNKQEINFKDYIVPPKCRMIRRITLTPTRQLLWPPEVMFSNRILRNFDPDYAVRVSFREDNMSRLSFSAPFADPGFLDACIKKPMTDGIRIGTRKYEFLAWSNSQIRDHGVWMYARDSKGVTAEHIRRWMGNFSHIHNVPKYMARMGQCFSQTEDALSVPLDPKLIRIEKDIEGGYDHSNGKPYCFSDGVGRISAELASEVRNALGHDKLCSAFQIRYKGCKGMLVTDPTLKDAQIVFRESMKKFDCSSSERLEIARTSAPVPVYLNRPFIALLSDLGVRYRMFLRLQEDMLKQLTDMLFVEDVAAEFLQSKTPTDVYDFAEISKSGIPLTTEPFFKSQLLALHRHHIEKIKLRANVAVDPSKGRNMLGVIDETGTLNYGEVFVQYSKDISYGETTRDVIIHKGVVLVTKNPCMYPGDVRKFTAVDVPALRHIVDCIVFPRRGHRPHPNEMAGSDLDGDEYVVLWAPELIFHRENLPPANFPAVHSPDVSPITVREMIEFLQEYIKNDQVGAIASAHLAHADNFGIFSKVCQDIAGKFSIAVDFAKNGQDVHLIRQERPMTYPDFMENNRQETYKSKKALGKMYRVCKDFESENQVSSIQYENVEVDPDLVYEGWERYKQNALEARDKYNALFRSVLRNYGIQHEVEALSGAFTNLHCRFQERKDRNEVEKVIIGCIKRLHKCMLEEFLEEFSSSADFSTTENAILQKASAWYVVTYSEKNAKFLSFPWTVSKYLVSIKVRRTLAVPSPLSPAIMKLDEKILQCESKDLLPHYQETLNLWYTYRIMCDPSVLKRALRTLVLWAQDAEVLEKPGHHRGLLYADVFEKIFMRVCETAGYISKSAAVTGQAPRKVYSAGQLCLEFLRFCSSFRFYTVDELVEFLGFRVFKHSKLGKCAIVTYHRFALTSHMECLDFDRNVEPELSRMKSINIDKSIFVRNPVDAASLRKAEEALKKYSKVERVNLREVTQTKKVCVSAFGTENAIKELKSILRKKNIVLKELFRTGIMPESK